MFFLFCFQQLLLFITIYCFLVSALNNKKKGQQHGRSANFLFAFRKQPGDFMFKVNTNRTITRDGKRQEQREL